MAKTAIIKLWNKRVGALAWSDSDGLGSFEFDPDFISSGWDVSPIMMPLKSSRGRIYRFPENRSPISSFRGLPGLLADILPDKYGNALINAWLQTQGRPSDSLNPLETLCFIGKRGMGALEIEPAVGKEYNKTEKIELDELVAIAGKILDTRQNFSASLNRDDLDSLSNILKIGTSAGGARAKAIIAYNPISGEVRSGQLNAPKGYSHWIIKFDGVNDDQLGTSNGYGRVEMAYHLMAKSASIHMSECRLLEENGRAHFMSKRFDRGEDGEKLHMQSLCAIRHYDFNMVGYYSYEQMFETMRVLSLTYPEAEQMFRRMVFNVLARNCDDHSKNFAFLMDKSGKWTLSPAFDICYAYRPGSTWVSKHSLMINGKRENIQKEDFLNLAAHMNIKKAAQIIEDVRTSVSNWKSFAEQVGLDPLLRDQISENLLPD